MQTSSSRIASIDILRGLVMIIMALDHTREFFHATAFTADPLDAETTTPGLFLTRWVTHFCAPVFVFLSGTSAYLSSQKKTNKAATSFLMKRGLWLIFAEIVIVTLGITFNPLYNLILLQVIWVIGCSMIILALLMRISFKVILATGLILFFGHNITDYFNLTGVTWNVLFTALGTAIPIGTDRFILVLYALLPWTSVMLLGYCAGYYFQQHIAVTTRKRFLLVSGSMAIALFIILRSINLYGDPVQWTVRDEPFRTLLDFMDVSKYPPSLNFLCITLGPALLLLAAFDNVKGKWQEVLKVYGNVPFFYFVVHFYLLHLLLVIFFFVNGYTTEDIVDFNIPMLFRPENFGYPLPIVYLIWALLVIVLYKPCQWFARYRKTHTYWLLKYM